jgi:hypothetical protein
MSDYVFVAVCWMRRPVVHPSLTLCLVSLDGVTTVEHFDEPALRNFLYHRQKPNAGILQRFVEPRGLFNSSVSRVLLGRCVCVIMRCSPRMLYVCVCVCVW